MLLYTRKHRYPIQRSAFTYCDDEVPSRLDYAKERYGRPFTTEQVEDVKTFFKILMLCIDLAGHVISNNNSTSVCMFIVSRHRFEHAVLKIHWAVMLVPCLLLGLGPPLAMATTFEFISAQSPSSMKGLLVGVFIGVKAFFQLISGVALILFAYRLLWDSEHMRASSCHQLWFWLHSLYMCHCTDWPYPVISGRQEAQVQGER